MLAVVLLLLFCCCVVLLGGGAAVAYWYFYHYLKEAPAPSSPPPTPSITPPPTPSITPTPPTPSITPSIPVKTGDLTADVHILEESEAQLVNYDGFEVWTPKEILTPTNPRDHMSGYHANPNMTSVGPRGYVVK